MARRVERWQAEAFSFAGFASLAVFGATQPVPRDFGDNRGCWPIKTSTPTTLRDEITRKLEFASATYPQRLLFQIWTRSLFEAKQLQERFLGLCEERFSDGYYSLLRKDFIDVGPDVDFDMLYFEIQCIAQDFKIRVIEDEELDYLLQRVDHYRQKKYSTSLENWLAAA